MPLDESMERSSYYFTRFELVLFWFGWGGDFSFYSLFFVYVCVCEREHACIHGYSECLLYVGLFLSIKIDVWVRLAVENFVRCDGKAKMGNVKAWSVNSISTTTGWVASGTVTYFSESHFLRVYYGSNNTYLKQDIKMGCFGTATKERWQQVPLLPNKHGLIREARQMQTSLPICLCQVSY